MASQKKLDCAYMCMADTIASLSRDARHQVGAVIVTKNGVVLTGYNGMPSGMSNVNQGEDGQTLPTVIHSELNCILKAAKEGVSVVGGTLYVTLSPCLQCAAMIIQAGVERVVWLRPYRCQGGVAYLQEAGVKVEQYNFE